jgi:hypothetical protein
MSSRMFTEKKGGTVSRPILMATQLDPHTVEIITNASQMRNRSVFMLLSV